MSKRTVIFVLAAMILADLASLYAGFGLGRLGPVSDENGWMENAQSVLIFLSFVVFLRTAGAVKTGAFTCRMYALLCVSLLLREIDIDDPALGVPKIILFFNQGGGRNAILGVLWVITLFFLARDFRTKGVELFRYLKTPSGIAVIAAGVLIVAAVPFDKNMLKLDHDLTQFWEEFVELNAYFVLLLGALWAKSCLQRIAQPS